MVWPADPASGARACQSWRCVPCGPSRRPSPGARCPAPGFATGPCRAGRWPFCRPGPWLPSRANIPALRVGCVQTQWRPARIGGSSSRLSSGRRIFSMGVIRKSGWDWKCRRMANNNVECCWFRHQNPSKHSNTTPTFARAPAQQPQLQSATSGLTPDTS